MTITRADLDAGLVDFSDIPMTGERVNPVHPGEILGDALGRRDILPSVLAEAMGVPVNRITGIIRGRRAITADTAIRLGRAVNRQGPRDRPQSHARPSSRAGPRRRPRPARRRPLY